MLSRLTKWTVLMALALLVPISALAYPAQDYCPYCTWDISFTNGTLTGSSAGLQLSGALVTGINGAPGLGSLVFTTGGEFGSGSLALPQFFQVPGGSMTITLDTVTNGFPTGVIFTGTFVGYLNWTPESSGLYQLSGYLYGNFYQTPTLAYFQLQYQGTVTNGAFKGTLGSGDVYIITPEPGTFATLGIGLIGLAAFRTKLFA